MVQENIVSDDLAAMELKVGLKDRFVESYIAKEEFNELRTNLLFCGDDIKTIVITSCLPGEGKSTTSMELCKSLSELGKQVLFIDADLRRSMILPYYLKEKKQKKQSIKGLGHFLSGQAQLSEIIFSTQYPGLNLIFAGHCPPNPVELLSGDRFRQLITYGKEKFDYVIVDAPPIGSVVDSAVIAAQCDGIIFVISVGKIKVKMLLDAKQQLEKSRCRILGTVVVGANRKHSGYYKKYDQYYRK